MTRWPCGVSTSVTATSRLRDRLVMTYAPLVKYIVFKKVRELPARCEVDDFISCGLEALIASLDRYDPAKGATLEQFAWTRIHGAVLDELRRQDWAPRSLRRWERDIAARREQFTGIHGRPPTREELADSLPSPSRSCAAARTTSPSPTSRRSTRSSSPTTRPRSSASTRSPATTVDADPEHAAWPRTPRRASAARSSTLPGASARSPSCCTSRTSRCARSATILGVSESRVCQIHTQLKRTLKSQLADEAQLLAAVGVGSSSTPAPPTPRAAWTRAPADPAPRRGPPASAPRGRRRGRARGAASRPRAAGAALRDATRHAAACRRAGARPRRARDPRRRALRGARRHVRASRSRRRARPRAAAGHSPRGSATAARGRPARAAPWRLLAQGLRGQPHRPVRDGRLQPAAVGVPVRAGRAVRRRAGAALRGAAGVRAGGPQADLPDGRRVDAVARASGACRRRRRRVGHRRGGRLDLVRLVVLGRAGHRVLPHLPLRVPHAGCARSCSRWGCSASSLLFVVATRRGADRAGAARRRRARTCRSGSRRSAAWSSRPRSLLGLVALFVALCAIYWLGAEGDDAVARGLAGRAGRHGRDGRRRPRLPALPRQRLHAAGRHLGACSC